MSVCRFHEWSGNNAGPVDAGEASAPTLVSGGSPRSPGMLDESAPYPSSQERLSPEETGYKSGIPPSQFRNSPEPSREQTSPTTSMVLVSNSAGFGKTLLTNTVNKAARLTMQFEQQ